jgi:hypothetical protein
LIAIAFLLCSRVHHLEGSSKPGWFETVRYTSADFYVVYVNITNESVHVVEQNLEAFAVAFKRFF